MSLINSKKEKNMRKYLLAAAVAAATLSTPAFAAEGEGRVEARGGMVWAGGAEDFVAGVAAGYDFDLGGTVFAGPEVSYDTDFEGADLVNLGGRIGVKASDKARIYVVAAYDVADGDEFNAGAGAQVDFTDRVYGKVEYRRYFFDGTDINFAGVGVGLKF